jgi:hypothetical protein
MNISSTRERRSHCNRFLAPYFRFRCVYKLCAVYYVYGTTKRQMGQQQADGQSAWDCFGRW